MQPDIDRSENTVPSRKRAHCGMSAHPHFGLNFLLRSSVYSRMHPIYSCPWKHSSNGWFMWIELWIVYVRSISNVLSSCKLILASFMPLFSRNNKQVYTASDHSHTHLIGLHSTTHSEVSWPPLLRFGIRAWIRLKSIVAAATIQIMKLA